MLFHEKLKELRLENEMTQKDLAEKLQLSTISIRQYEQGSREPSIEKLLKLAVIFDVSLDDLLCLEDFKKEREGSD